MDYQIRGGIIIDGTGASPYEANICIDRDRIVYIGPDEVDSKIVVDARGLIVTPGFIDTHAHSEFTLLADGRAEGKLLQGVTTEINGNCGLSAAPLYGESLAVREAELDDLGIKERWSTFREYFGFLKSRGTGLNFATLCGHGNIRGSVLGYSDEGPDGNQVSEMKKLLLDALKDGAIGLSTGLIYPPGVYSETEELVMLAGVLSDYNNDLIYTSHMRSEGSSILDSIAEVCSIGREAGVRVHISHVKTAGRENWNRIDSVINLMDEERSHDIELTCDRYPYIAASTEIDSILPPWIFKGGIDEALRRLRNPEIREEISRALKGRGEDYWKSVAISSVRRAENKWMEGLSVSEVSGRLGRSSLDAVIDILIDERLRVGGIFFSMSEENLKRFFTLPYTMIGSDSSVRSFSGPTHTGKPHPRGFGTFPRFIGRYVRDEGLMGLTEAIKRITSLPASTFRLKKRGILKDGFYADITVFDFECIIDRATFEDPFKGPEGILYVFVNGGLSVEKGMLRDGRYGRVLIG